MEQGKKHKGMKATVSKKLFRTIMIAHKTSTLEKAHKLDSKC
jgi:hypothetical protein